MFFNFSIDCFDWDTGSLAVRIGNALEIPVPCIGCINTVIEYLYRGRRVVPLQTFTTTHGN